MKRKVRRGVGSYVYVLRLSNGWLYVGLTYDVDARIKQHYEGSGAVVTRLHKPIALEYVIPLGKVSKAEATIAEDIVAVELIIAFGEQRIRGGSYHAVERKHRTIDAWEWILIGLKRRVATIREWYDYGGFERSGF